MSTKVYILCMTAMSISMLAFGLYMEDSIFRTIFLIVGGIYLGHIASIALDNPTQESL
jgi:hypothetical protein